MGTLTGYAELLPEQCDHKLPTSCRLTATALCCACQDKRAHSSSYSTYVDGVGMTMRATRWQRYCYYCREFWTNRVAATDPPMQPSETRVPEVPDQTPFIHAWLDYHRGFRFHFCSDGTVEREELIREKTWEDTEPGTLPVANSEDRRMALQQAGQTAQTTQENVSLDTTLDHLLADVDDEATQQITDSSTNPQSTAEADGQARREADEAALEAACSRLREAERRCASIQLRKQRAACELEASENELRQAQSQRRQAVRDQRAAEMLFRALSPQDETNQRSAQRFARVFGTREEIERQGAEYVSPLTSMFSRAYERYHVAEEVRAEQRAATQNAERHRQFAMDLAQRGYPLLLNAFQTQLERGTLPEEPTRTLDDALDQRPPPKTDSEMTILLTCKICLQQTADIAVLPCGHLVMCSFCADICVPTRNEDQTQPLHRSTCPLCRRQVKRRVHIYTS